MTGPGGLGTGVERINYVTGGDSDCGCDMERAPDGDYVEYTDYAALEAECARLRGKIEEVRAVKRYYNEATQTSTGEHFAVIVTGDGDGDLVEIADVLAILDRA